MFTTCTLQNLLRRSVKIFFFPIFSTRESRTFSSKMFSSILTICVCRGLDSLPIPIFMPAPNLRGTTDMKSAVFQGKNSFVIAAPRHVVEGCCSKLFFRELNFNTEIKWKFQYFPLIILVFNLLAY